jgi:PadR family transcriptional regulator, regulatory protein PadR
MRAMKTRERSPEGYQDLYSNLIHLYVLHHACRQPTFGLQMIEEFARLGYKVSPGTMYPLLGTLERKGLLRSREVRTGGTARRIYRATAAGRKALASAESGSRDSWMQSQTQKGNAQVSPLGEAVANGGVAAIA